MRKRIYLNENWGFTKEYDDAMHRKDYDMKKLCEVRLPHTIQETSFHYFDESIYQAVSAYRKIIKPEDSWKGKHILLTVEAAGHQLEVYLNGELKGMHKCGYTAYTIELSDSLIRDEENILVLKVDSRESLNIPPFGNVVDYMTYGGLYREVYLDIMEENYILEVFPKPKWLGGGKGSIECEVTKKIADRGVIICKLYDSGQHLLHAFPAVGNGIIVSDVTTCISSEVMPDIEPWEPELPTLYTLCTELWEDDRVMDRRMDRIGFREAVFRADGFYLNGTKMKLRGLNRHQSYPYVGYAMPESMQKFDADILKHELCVNIVRTSHYPQSRHFCDRCDELGLLVFTEIPGWQYIGDEAWREQAVRNTEDMVKQYRNHPSVILWGVRINESMDHDELYRKTNDTARALDDTRQTSGVRYIPQSSLLEDVHAHNDFSHLGNNPGCVPKSQNTSDLQKGYLITEFGGHIFPTKAFDNEDHRTEHMLRHARVMDAYYQEEDIAGGIGWCMFDYNTHKDFGSGDRICYHGVTDMFRNGKFAACLYASQGEQEDILEITSSMDIGDHSAGQLKGIYALTNADSIRIYKNDVLFREYDSKDSPFPNLPHGPILLNDFEGSWGSTYTVYRFEAVKNGKVVKSVEKKPMKTLWLKVDVSHAELSEKNTYDVAAVRIRACNESGETLPYYSGPVRLEVQGDISLIGPDIISLNGGMGGTYVRSTGTEGTGTLTLTGNEFQKAVIDFNSIKATQTISKSSGNH